MRLRAALIAIALTLASNASAQNLRALARATSVTGGNDSTLVLVNDSAFRTRAQTLAEIRKALSVKSFDSLLTTVLNLTGGAVTGAPTWNVTQSLNTSGSAATWTTGRTLALTGDVTYTSPTLNGSGNVTASATVNAAPAGALTGATLASGVTGSSLTSFGVNARTDSATGAARSQKLTTARTIGGVSFDGTANIIPDSATGVARAQTLTTTRALWGQNFNGSAAITGSLTSVGDITGGASSMTLQAGTGNSRQLALQTTTSGGTATTALRFNEVQQALFTDGNSTRPGIAFATDSTMGMYRLASTQLAFRVSAANVLNLSSAQVIALNGTAAAPTYVFSGSPTTGLYRAGADTLGISLAGAATLFITGGAGGTIPTLVGKGAGGSLDILAGTSANRNLNLQSSDASGVATRFLAGVGAQMQAQSGTAALPSYTYDLSSTTGLYRFGADTLGVAIAGANAFQVPALGKLVGGAGNMTLTAGTGNSRTMTLQTTTSAGTAKNTLVLGADTSATFLGAGTFAGTLTSGALSATTGAFSGLVTASGGILVNGGGFAAGRIYKDATNGVQIVGTTGTTSDLRLLTPAGTALFSVPTGTVDIVLASGALSGVTTISPAADNSYDLGTAALRWKELYINPAASGVGDTYICLSTGQQVHAGATCAASTLKMKDNVASYTSADAILNLRPVTFTFKSGYYGQRAEIGLIAEEAALVDPRFVFKATKFDTLTAVAPTITLNALTQKFDTAAVVIKPGEPEALNVSSLVAALIAQVQVQKRQLDSLSAVVFTLQQKAP